MEAAEQLEAFGKLPKKTADREKIFKSLLPLAREASAYESEGQVSMSMAAILKDDASLKKSFDSYVKDQSKSNKIESCKSQNLEKKTAEQLCLMNAGGKNQDGGTQKDAQVQKCTQAFDLQGCLKDGKK